MRRRSRLQKLRRHRVSDPGPSDRRSAGGPTIADPPQPSMLLWQPHQARVEPEVSVLLTTHGVAQCSPLLPDIAHLEHKVRALEARLRDLPSQSESAPPVTEGQHDRLQVLRTPNSSQAPDRLVDTLWLDCEHESPGRLFAYRGRTTGIEVLRGLRQLCDAFVNLSVNPDQKAAEMANALDCAAPSSDLPTISPPSPVFLSEAIVRRWIDLAFARSFVLWPFLDRESFNAYVNRTLQAGVLGESSRDDDQLALLHAVLALGQRNDPDLIGLDGIRSHSAETRG